MTTNRKNESDLDRAMRKLKADGITISVSPAPGREAGFGDRVLGVIQAAAEQHGIAENPIPRWNGIPITARRGTAVVADAPNFSHYWARHLVGQRIAVVEVNLDGVNYGGGIDYLDDGEGRGWAKVTTGGNPRTYHASVAIEPGSFVETKA